MERKSRYSGSLGVRKPEIVTSRVAQNLCFFFSQHRFLSNNIIKMKMKSEIDLTCILKALVNIWTLPWKQPVKRNKWIMHHHIIMQMHHAILSFSLLYSCSQKQQDVLLKQEPRSLKFWASDRQWSHRATCNAVCLTVNCDSKQHKRITLKINSRWRPEKLLFDIWIKYADGEMIHCSALCNGSEWRFTFIRKKIIALITFWYCTLPISALSIYWGNN